MSIKATQGDGKSPDDKASFVCWSKDTQVQALRVEADATYIFPYSHFVFVTLKASAQSEELRVSLTTHDVVIHGRNLRDLALAFQKLAVEWIIATPARYALLAGRETAHVERIEVTELEPRQAAEAHGDGLNGTE